MDEPIFPVEARQVVPILRIDEDEITRVQTRKGEMFPQAPRVRLLRIAIASLFKLTIMRIEGENVQINGVKSDEKNPK